MGKACHGIPVGVFMIVAGVCAAALAFGNHFHDVAGDHIILRVFDCAREGVDQRWIPLRRSDKMLSIGLGGLAFFTALAMDGHAHGKKP